MYPLCHVLPCLQPPPAPAYQAMWVSNLLLGGTVGEYENTSEWLGAGLLICWPESHGLPADWLV